jgi:hypothetical protein
MGVIYNVQTNFLKEFPITVEDFQSFEFFKDFSESLSAIMGNFPIVRELFLFNDNIKFTFSFI